VKKLRVYSKAERRERLNDGSKNNVFVFCDKTTGAAQFRAGSAADLDFAVERIAGLLAMKCLACGSEPGDFDVLVPAHPIFVGRLIARASKLLEEGRSIACPASLSPRQKEILRSVLCNHANKEIASKLNITVRTVKFHISTLLSKFGVENRAELARRAANLLRSAVGNAEESDGNRMGGTQSLRPFALGSTASLGGKSRNIRFPGRTLTA
jgi:DNA-binding CsgD family transcriptional regulator